MERLLDRDKELVGGEQLSGKALVLCFLSLTPTLFYSLPLSLSPSPPPLLSLPLQVPPLWGHPLQGGLR